MLTKPLNDVTDKTLQEHLRHVQEEGQGKVINLDAAPTTAGGELSPGEIGHNGTTLYLNINGTIYSVGLVAV